MKSGSGLIITLFLCILLSGCGGVQAGEEEKTISMVYIGDKGDFSYLQRAFQGLDKAQDDLSFSVRDIQWNPTAPIDPVTASDGTRSDAVIIMGAIMNGYEQNLTNLYPDTPVILIDGGAVPGRAAKSWYFSMYGTSFLAGVIAANQTKTGKIGIIAGVDAPVLRGFSDGFIDGAHAENPDIQVFLSYIADNYSGFSMPEKAGERTREMYQNGTDVIYQIAGSSGVGVIQTASTLPGLFIIGSDADQSELAPDTVLASAVKNLDTVIYGEMQDLCAGSFTPGAIISGLAEGGSSLVINPRFENLSDVIEKRISQARDTEKEYLTLHPLL